MAEQKTEDQKPPTARRGARPFAGPAGPSSAARPVLRPVVPANRPGSAPFAPPAAPERGTLGTTRPAHSAVPAVARVAPSLPIQPLLPAAAELTPEIAPVRPTAPTPVFASAIESESPTSAPSRSIAEVPVAELPVAAPDPSETLAPAVDAQADAGMQVIESTLAPIDAPAAPIETAPIGAVANPNASTGRPVTSDMVAVDAFDAFDAAWGPPDTSQAPPPEALTAPLDESSLGSGGDAQQLWADDITAAPENVKSVTPPTNHHVDVDVVETAWTSAEASDAGLPAWLADNSDTSRPAAATPGEAVIAEHAVSGEAYEEAAAVMPPIAETPEPMALDASLLTTENERWPDPLLAEYAPYIPTPSSIQAIPGHNDPVFAIESVRAAELPAQPLQTDATPIVEPTASTQLAPDPSLSSGDDASPANDPTRDHGLRVSAALDRLAERVRSGEIDVSSVAPEAPEAAVLASVLAALLGGSSSR